MWRGQHAIHLPPNLICFQGIPRPQRTISFSCQPDHLQMSLHLPAVGYAGQYFIRNTQSTPSQQRELLSSAGAVTFQNARPGSRGPRRAARPSHSGPGPDWMLFGKPPDIAQKDELPQPLLSGNRTGFYKRAFTAAAVRKPPEVLPKRNLHSRCCLEAPRGLTNALSKTSN